MHRVNVPDSFHSVIFGTDFSATDRVAGRYGALLARHYDAELIIAHAFILQQPSLEAEQLGHVHSRQRRHLDDRLAETVRELKSIVPQISSVLREGSAVDVLGKLSQQHRPALIVLSTHGGGSAERLIKSSVAEGILRTVHDPVLTVGPHVPMPEMETLAFRRILYATDFSEASVRAISYASALAGSFGSDLDVLHVMRSNDERRREIVNAKQNELLTAFRQDPIGIEVKSLAFVEFGKASNRILQHAREHGIDLIVLGAHHHSELARHFRTGPAFQIIIAAACPVMTVLALETSPSR